MGGTGAAAAIEPGRAAGTPRSSPPQPFRIDTAAGPLPLPPPVLSPTSRLYMLGKSATGLSDLDLLRSQLSASSEGMAQALSPVRSSSFAALFGEGPEGRAATETLQALLAPDRASAAASAAQTPNPGHTAHHQLLQGLSDVEMRPADAPFLQGLSIPDLFAALQGHAGEGSPDGAHSGAHGQLDAEHGWIPDHAEPLPPLPTTGGYTYAGHQPEGHDGPRQEGVLPVLLQHVVDDGNGGPRVELVLFDPSTGEFAVVPPELAAGLRFVNPADHLGAPAGGDPHPHSHFAAGPHGLMPVPEGEESTFSGSPPRPPSRPASVSPTRPRKHKPRSRSLQPPPYPIPSLHDAQQQPLYPSRPLFSEPPGSEDGSEFDPAAYRSRAVPGSADTTPRTSRTSSLASEPAGSRGSSPGREPLPAEALEGLAIGQKPKKVYYCGFEGCERSFTTSGHLSRHKRIHVGTKSFLCPIPGCPSSFFRSDNMMTHYRVHARKLGIRALEDAHAVAGGEYDADLSAAGLDGAAQKAAWEAALGVAKMSAEGEVRVAKGAWGPQGSTGSLIGDVAVLAGSVEPAGPGGSKRKSKGAARA